MAIVLAGITASTLIGAVYFVPVAVIMGIINRKRVCNIGNVKIVLPCVVSASILAITIGEFTAISEALMFGTVFLVLSAISAAVLATSRMIRW
jgi:hypothetical protein